MLKSIGLFGIRISSRFAEERVGAIYTPQCFTAVRCSIESINLEVDLWVDLMPLEQFLALHSPIVTVYLYVCYTEEWEQVADYFASLWPMVFNSWECTMWIRCSTGRLSVDLVPPDIAFGFAPYTSSVGPFLRPGATPLNVMELIAIESLGLREYHDVCSAYLHQFRYDSISTSATVHTGGVISWEHVEIVSVKNVEARSDGWFGEVAKNGWSRYRADDVFKTEIMLR
ncbi:hypothetical protein B0H16DRAFT_644408 [Mycena metata]|uniref:Uncharacterized protein n=1 Tax=Mycena metata TaxID=1033252 RepID=A0AAD7MC44_9AGAR|nr:hypothetical protein B0H16DRAFT_644408 [Mycena metata]